MKIQVEIGISPELRTLLQDAGLLKKPEHPLSIAIRKLNKSLQEIVMEQRRAEAQNRHKKNVDDWAADFERRTNEHVAMRSSNATGPKMQTFAYGEEKVMNREEELAKERADAMQAQFEGQYSPEEKEGTTL